LSCIGIDGFRGKTENFTLVNQPFHRGLRGAWGVRSIALDVEEV
jgi:hypothetical protein